MKAAFLVVLPIAFLLLLQFPIDSAAETDETSGLSQQASDTQQSSRVKRAGYNMMRLARSLHMLRLGKRAANDDASPIAPTPNLSPENMAKMEELYQQLPLYEFPYADPYDDEEDGVADDTSDGADLYYPYAVDEFGDQHFRHRRSEPGTDDGGNHLGYGDDSAEDGPWKRSRMAMLRLGKRQDEQGNDEFSDEKRYSGRQMSMLRLGKRPMNMLRLGKRPMNMLRLGKRPMNMLRLGKRPMNMLRLGKRPMNMLRLGKRPMNMLRLGKRPMSSLRLGKRPMNMLRLGKRQLNMLRLGKRSVETQKELENVARA